MKINPYLTFDGECETAFAFYKSVFGGEFSTVSRFAEMPPQEGMPPLPDALKNRVMHIALPISAHTVLMGSDTIPEMHHLAKGNNISLSIDAASTQEAERIFETLSAAGKVIMPLEKTFWGAFFGMCTDKFGIHWMVNYDEPEPISRH